jgi:DNA repair protein RecN (Recombination protein N)
LLNNEDRGVLSSMKDTLKNLQAAVNMSTLVEPLRKRLEETWIELKDIAAALDQEQQAVAYDPERLQVIQERLSRLYSLQKKHGVKTTDELLVIFENLETSLQQEDEDEQKIKTLEQELVLVEKEVLKKAKALSDQRGASAAALADGLVNLLVRLGMPDALIRITVDPIAPSLLGIDKVTLRFSANKGVEPQELKQAASGGEFSRLMLAVKVILAEKTYLPTLIFDEIDTGVSGEIALRMGQMMKSIAHAHQVITITHLPQVAALGDDHYYVYKDNSGNKSTTRMKSLTAEERVQEIAQMIAGATPSSTAVSSARELLAAK